MTQSNPNVTKNLSDGIEKLGEAIELIDAAGVEARDAEWGGIAALVAVLDEVFHVLVHIEDVANRNDEDAKRITRSVELTV